MTFHPCPVQTTCNCSRGLNLGHKLSGTKALKLQCKQRSGAYISTAAGQATRHRCRNITQSCGRAKTLPGGRAQDGGFMISSKCWHVGRLTRGWRARRSQSVVNFNGQLTSSQQRCPPPRPPPPLRSAKAPLPKSSVQVI